LTRCDQAPSPAKLHAQERVMTDPWILYTEEMDQVDGWFFGADVDLFSDLLACQ
jgi:hypothetical protein